MEPLDVYVVWLDSQELPDLVLRTFAEVEEVMKDCHAGNPHPIQWQGNHQHHTSHAFEWAQPNDSQQAATPDMLHYGCTRYVTDWSFMTDEEADEAEANSCPCHFARPLFPERDIARVLQA